VSEMNAMCALVRQCVGLNAAGVVPILRHLETNLQERWPFTTQETIEVHNLIEAATIGCESNMEALLVCFTTFARLALVAQMHDVVLDIGPREPFQYDYRINLSQRVGKRHAFTVSITTANLEEETLFEMVTHPDKMLISIEDQEWELTYIIGLLANGRPFKLRHDEHGQWWLRCPWSVVKAAGHFREQRSGSD